MTTNIEKVTIGGATLYCGDCLDVLPKLKVKADAIITDPPFGITNCDWDKVPSLDHFWKVIDRKTKQTANFVLFGCGKFSVDLVNSKYCWFRYDLIWAKNNKVGFLNANLMPMRNHEHILVFGRPGFQKAATYNPQKTPGGKASIKIVNRKSGVYKTKGNHTSISDGTLHPCSVLLFNSDKNKNHGLHPTLKPLALMEFLVKSYTNAGDIVIDPFAGSGTTGVAAIQMGRTFIGIEKKKQYFDIACQRIEQAYAEYRNHCPGNKGKKRTEKLFDEKETA